MKWIDRIDRFVFAYLPIVGPVLLVLLLALIICVRYLLTGR